MARHLVFVLGCLLCAFSLSVGDEVPTIAISCGSTPLSTLPEFQQSMDTLVFKKMLSNLWNKDTKVVMVMEDELSVEDFTMKDTDGHSLLKLFENSAERRFFPSVDQPEKAIELLSKNGFAVKAYNDETYVNGSEKVVALVDFHENNHHNNEDRHLTLKKHNNDISKIFNTLCKQYTNVVLLLSGKLNPWIHKTKASNAHHLVTRHLMAVESKPSKPLIIKDEKKKSLIYSSSYPTLKVDNGPAVELQAAPSTDVTLDSRESFLKVGTGFLLNDTVVKLYFRFKISKSSWNLEKIEYVNLGATNQLSPRGSIGAPKGMSFFSDGPVVFSDNSVILTFNNKFQVEPWLSSSAKFSTPEVQNYFFTAPILAGLFVVFILLFIVTWGIIMIMDIKTMDRFDDPKGKTISINVVE